jgi:hypothetical protein
MKNSTAFVLSKPMEPEGIVIHSSGIPNSYLRRYVQPSNGSADYELMQKMIGENKQYNDYNHTHRTHNFHYWIGKRSDTHIPITVLTHPMNIKT